MKKTMPAAKKAKPASVAPQEEKPEYKPTPREQEALEALKAARKARKPSASLEVKKGASGGANIRFDHKDDLTGQLLFMQAIGTTDFDFCAGILKQIVNTSSQGREPDEAAVNFVLSIIKGIEPRDQTEAMLAAQMAATHMATMTFARRLAHVDNITQQDSAQNAFNKLARTFTTQMEALKRYRSTGQQKVTVEHVTVNAGGQAIVGNVSHGTPANDAGQPPSVPLAVITAPSQTPLQLPGGGGVSLEKVRLTS
ncbi:MAG: hypothetical protein WCD20_10615 [Rhodomicrobium sp.]